MVGGMTDWTPRGDPFLALLPAERPWAFDALPFEEQQWRARVYLAVWIRTGSHAYAWATALRKEPDEAEVRRWTLQNITLDVIMDGLASLQEPLTATETTT
jgi:hypothetical protein